MSSGSRARASLSDVALAGPPLRAPERGAAADSLRLAMELLRRMETKRQELAAALVRSQEQERQRIASYLHDESIQAMAVVGLRLQVLREELTDPAVIDAVDSIGSVVAESVSRLRNLIFELDPTDIEAVGLGRALRGYLGHYFRDSGISFSVRGGFGTEPPDEIRRTIYRIVHEAVVNARKHAAPSKVSVTLSGGSRGYKVTVRDDGRGFDVDAVLRSERRGHLGLRLMRDRTRLAGGSLTITSTRGKGTTVLISLPDRETEIALIGERQVRTG